MSKPIKYWYFMTYNECPFCGGGKTYKEKRKLPKPKDPSKRIKWEPVYDYCLEYQYGG